MCHCVPVFTSKSKGFFLLCAGVLVLQRGVLNLLLHELPYKTQAWPTTAVHAISLEQAPAPQPAVVITPTLGCCAVGATREESHALYTELRPEDTVDYVPIVRGSITVHNERVIHGSGPNQSATWRKAYVLAFSKRKCVEEERAMGFTHSHNDKTSWDRFTQQIMMKQT